MKIVTEKIEKYIKEHNLTKIKFCKLCNIGTRSFIKIMSNARVIKDIDLIKIANIIGCKKEELIKENES